MCYERLKRARGKTEIFTPYFTPFADKNMRKYGKIQNNMLEIKKIKKREEALKITEIKEF